MKIPPVKGTRDFYPADMAVRNFIIDGWKKVSIRHGFEEYDGPILEHLQMYTQKSGNEIVEQLFSLKDRGGRDLALRPEITPTLARMVNQRVNSLPKPIKWFSVPRLFRAERPQKGRLREFFQWNIDIIGVDDARADAEVVFTTLDYLHSEVGLTNKDIQVKISSRKLLASVLRKIGIPEDKLDSIYTLLDKKDRLAAETFNEMLGEQVPAQDMREKILVFLSIGSSDGVTSYAELIKRMTDDVTKAIGLNDSIKSALVEIEVLFASLYCMDVSEYCVFDPTIVRGLSYYTGAVFEVHALGSELRAICGGGRYDDLLSYFGGLPMPAVGMGMGDVVLEILLKEKGLLDKQIPKRQLEYFVAVADKICISQSSKITAQLQTRGFSANFSYKPLDNLSKQLKEASAQNTKKCIIIGKEYLDGQLVIKDMATGEQKTIPMDKFFDELGKSK